MTHSLRRTLGATLTGVVLLTGLAFAPQAASAASAGPVVPDRYVTYVAKDCKKTVWSTAKGKSSYGCVLALQKRLNYHGFKAGTEDGRFGAGTKAAVIRFQKANRLPADGIVGAKSSAVLCTVERRVPYPSVGFC